jgi:hypothetical protein
VGGGGVSEATRGDIGEAALILRATCPVALSPFDRRARHGHGHGQVDTQVRERERWAGSGTVHLGPVHSGLFPFLLFLFCFQFCFLFCKMRASNMIFVK